ncbi:hypothetical protein JK192_14200 [Gluconobacter cerinus]|jgi:hypothetical protein|uniref:hypothetical protein n=1 Tax=Acetobacteraceae TaxID=433 RepID=UPI0002998BB0|nr:MULTISPECIES: hypothetical protein [Acetobacteraceae]AFW03277.1 hypothetical protein B932_3738 [Gluconobacter oxydans H24]MBS1032526.1 hypothetical protein [Gluconobacter cerinus]MBS1104086.1 hypothetical protein [Gluconobacter sp. Dm-62]OUJ08855.1 hypothetical protein HK25_12565 [Acetobacter sp. DsW_059]
MNAEEHLMTLNRTGGRFNLNEIAAAFPETAEEAPFAPGHLLVFPRWAVHAVPRILSHPIVFLAIDTLRRAPDDVVFVDPADGTPSGFIAGI